MPTTCDRCDGTVDVLGVCTSCGRNVRIGARDRIRMLTGSFTEHDERLSGGDPLDFEGYADALERSRERSGLDEAVVCGIAEVGGVRCAITVSDFAFMGGSMGLAVGEKVARAFDGARRDGLPMLCVTASGGARMQEGMVSLVQMAKTAEARRRHAHAGLGQVTLLTSPTTGGVYASFASLADVVLAEPEATIGFAGPRVVAELTGNQPPPDVHTAEFAHAHGHVDAIVERSRQRDVLASVLRGLTGTPGRPKVVRPRARPPQARRDGPGAWERLQIARDQQRPKARELLDELLEDSFELAPADAGVAVRVGALRTEGNRVLAVAQDATGTGRIGPRGFELACRALEMAGRLHLPVLTLIDTRGADPLPDSEAAGIAALIARTFTATLQCSAPILAVVTGEGGSGGALAMAPGDRLLAWEHAVFSVIAPEGASSILYRDGAHAPELAERLRITSHDLVDLGIADAVVPEPDGGAQADPATAVRTLADTVAHHLAELAGMPNSARLAHRRRKWRRLGADWLRVGRPEGS